MAAGFTDEPAGYIIVDIVDNCVHIAQVTVHPRYAHQGIGRRLIEEAASWGGARELRALTLTTFEHVPWNAPYYRRLGFETVPEELWSKGLRTIVADEDAMGLAAWPRVVMKRPARLRAPAAISKAVHGESNSQESRVTPLAVKAAKVLAVDFVCRGCSGPGH